MTGSLVNRWEGGVVQCGHWTVLEKELQRDTAPSFRLVVYSSRHLHTGHLIGQLCHRDMQVMPHKDRVGE